jgi:two-component system nitrate/nitrite response regulator NarL
MRVLIVDDHELLAESLRIMLTADGYDVGVPPVRPSDVYEAASTTPPDVVLLDLDLGEVGGDGAALVEGLAVGGARVVVVSGTLDRLRVAACLESGACGYVSKAAPLEELIDAIGVAAAGGDVMPDSERQDLLAELRLARVRRRAEIAPFEDLTGRERFILAQVMDGRTAPEIATGAFVTEATVRTQIRAVLGKLGVRSQLAAVAAARRAGWDPALSTQ